MNYPNGALAPSNHQQTIHDLPRGRNNVAEIEVLPINALRLPLTQKEQNRLRDCEEILQRGLRTFLEVGNALLTIKEQQLYRATHPTFETYCRERWGMCRSYAWRVMGAAERIRLLPPGDDLPKPANEFQVRPFLKLQAEDFPSGWEEVVSRAKNGRVTPGLVRQVVAQLLSRDGQPGRAHPRGRRLASKAYVQLGQVLVLLSDAKQSVERGDAEQALGALERIEALLFSSDKPLR